MIIGNRQKDILYTYQDNGYVNNLKWLGNCIEYIQSCKNLTEKIDAGVPKKIITNTDNKCFSLNILSNNIIIMSILRDNLTSPAISGQVMMKIENILSSLVL